MIRVKRAYDPPAPDDGARYLVDRIWPRGLRKEELRIHGWVRDAAPSDALRRWFRHDPARWDEFRRRYAAELDRRPESWQPLLEAARRGTVTLLFGARDDRHNNAVALAEYLTGKLRGRTPRAASPPGRRRPRGRRPASSPPAPGPSPARPRGAG